MEIENICYQISQLSTPKKVSVVQKSLETLDPQTKLSIFRSFMKPTFSNNNAMEIKESLPLTNYHLQKPQKLERMEEEKKPASALKENLKSSKEFKQEVVQFAVVTIIEKLSRKLIFQRSFNISKLSVFRRWCRISSGNGKIESDLPLESFNEIEVSSSLSSKGRGLAFSF